MLTRKGALCALGSLVLLMSISSTSGAMSSGEVLRWGAYINKGGGSADKQKPTVLTFDAPVEQIATSNSASYALLADGTVWAWGNGDQGQLGSLPTQVDTNTPVEVQFPAGVTIASLGTGGADDTEYAIDTNGGAWAWGLNADGDLCDGNTRRQDVPVHITSLPPVIAVSGASNHVLWLTSTGTVYACGDGVYGELGNGHYVKNEETPGEVLGLPTDDPVTKISTGRGYSGVLTESGVLYEFGNNSQGQLGIGSTADQATPQPVPGTFSQVYLGGDAAIDGHVLAITTTGVVESWGCNSTGQLGNGDTVNEESPVDVDVPSGVTFTFVAAGGEASAAIDSSGNLWTWGDNSTGQLGTGRFGGYSTAPMEVQSNVTQVQTTAHNVLALG